MKYRKFGSLDWTISALGFGCMRLPTKKFLFWKKLDQPAAIKLIRHGIDRGINYIDTAWGYHGGKSEPTVGLALQEGYREKVKLVTKLPMWRIKKVEDFDLHLKKQLERLQTDHIDMYLFHALNKKHFEVLKKLNLIKKMEEAKASGLIRKIGFSFHDNFHVFKEIVDYYNWDMVQIQYNYMDTQIQATTEGLKYAAGKGIAVVIMEPIKGGKLANPNQEILDIMNTAPKKRTPVDWALQFLWNQSEIACVLSGMGSFQMVDENIESANNSGINSLNDEETKIITQLAEKYQNLILIPCTACEYCMPCPSGVNIPQNFAILNDLSRIGNKKQAIKQYSKLNSSKKEEDVAKENGNASMCIKCMKCIDQCPQNIDIPTELEKVHAILADGREINEFSFN